MKLILVFFSMLAGAGCMTDRPRADITALPAISSELRSEAENQDELLSAVVLQWLTAPPEPGKYRRFVDDSYLRFPQVVSLKRAGMQVFGKSQRMPDEAGLVLTLKVTKWNTQQATVRVISEVPPHIHISEEYACEKSRSGQWAVVHVQLIGAS